MAKLRCVWCGEYVGSIRKGEWHHHTNLKRLSETDLSKLKAHCPKVLLVQTDEEFDGTVWDKIAGYSRAAARKKKL